MDTTQQKLHTIIQGSETHSAIDGAIDQLSKYATEKSHEQKFINRCRALIMQRIVFVSFKNVSIQN